jgi:hypothetical protein
MLVIVALNHFQREFLQINHPGRACMLFELASDLPRLIKHVEQCRHAMLNIMTFLQLASNFCIQSLFVSEH